jgi:hypothetical protein
MQSNFQTSSNGTGSTPSLTASADILIDVAETPQPAVSEADARYDIVLLDPKHIPPVSHRRPGERAAPDAQ